MPPSPVIVTSVPLWLSFAFDPSALFEIFLDSAPKFFRFLLARVFHRELFPCLFTHPLKLWLLLVIPTVVIGNVWFSHDGM